MLIEKAAGRLLKSVAKHDVRLQLGSPQVEVSMPEPQLFSRKLFPFSPGHRNCRSVGGTKHAKRGRSDFDFPTWHLRIADLERAEADFPVNCYNCLLAQCSSRRNYVRRSPLRIEGDLYEPRAITKIREDYSAEVSDPVYPAGYRYPAARMLLP